MKRSPLALLLVAVPILSAGQSDAPIRRAEIRVGDSWTNRSTNVLGPGTDEHETRVSFADDKVILTITTRKSDGKEFDASWTPVRTRSQTLDEISIRLPEIHSRRGAD